MVTFTCESCGTVMEATDVETLDWGISTHACGHVRDELEQCVIDWLVCCYGEPFWWFATGKSPLVVM